MAVFKRPDVSFICVADIRWNNSHVVIAKSCCDEILPKCMEWTLAIKVVRNKKFENLITDNFFSCHLIVMQLCTIIELGNTQPKLKSKFFKRSSFPW